MLKKREGRNETIKTETNAQSQIEKNCVHFVYCYYKEQIKEKKIKHCQLAKSLKAIKRF